MPFQFQAYTSPLTTSIAQTLQQAGAIEAQRAYTTGNAAANAALQSGNAWGGAIRGIGETIGALPGQIQAAKASEQNQAIRGQQLEAGALQLGQAQRTEQTAQLVDQYKARVAELADNPAFHNEDGTLNAEGLAGQLSTLPGGAAGPTRPVDREALSKVVTPINADITAARDAKLKWDETKTNALARLAGSAYTLGSKDGNYAPYVQLGLATALKNGLITQADANAVLVPMVEHPETMPALLQSMAARSTLAPIKLGAEETLVNPLNPSQVLAKGAEKPPTETELALKASGNDPTKAMALLKPPPAPRPLNEQLLEAIAKGDTTKASQITQTLKTAAAAGRDPDAAAMARELGGLRADEARARLEVIKQGKPLPAMEADKISDIDKGISAIRDLRESIATGSTGLVAQAEAKYVPNALADLVPGAAAAKATQADITRAQQVVGRIIHGGVMRANDAAAAGKYMPVLGDSPSVIASKLDAVEKLALQTRTDHLSNLGKSGYNVSNFAAADVAAPGGATAGVGLVTMRAPNGQTRQVPASDVDHYKTLGAVVVP